MMTAQEAINAGLVTHRQFFESHDGSRQFWALVKTDDPRPVSADGGRWVFEPIAQNPRMTTVASPNRPSMGIV